MFEETDIAVDHNQLVMAMLRKVALRHGLQALLHEKPFAGINGSGKHCNWSMSIAADNAELDGTNLLKPGKTPHQNLRFLALPRRGAQGRAQARRACCAPASPRRGNEHRLGANEAPPAIISVFMGEMLTQRDRGHRGRQDVARQAREQAMLKLGVAQAAGDREGQHRPQPHVAVRLHGQQVRVPRRRLARSRSPSRSMLLQRRGRRGASSELTEQLRGGARRTRSSVDDAVLKVVRAVVQGDARRCASRATTTRTSG